MPGMMDTVLNIGLNDQGVRGMIEATGTPASFMTADEIAEHYEFFSFLEAGINNPMYRGQSNRAFSISRLLQIRRVACRKN
jgi:hypothetical protein